MCMCITSPLLSSSSSLLVVVKNSRYTLHSNRQNRLAISLKVYQYYYCCCSEFSSFRHRVRQEIGNETRRWLRTYRHSRTLKRLGLAGRSCSGRVASPLMLSVKPRSEGRQSLSSSWRSGNRLGDWTCIVIFGEVERLCEMGVIKVSLGR